MCVCVCACRTNSEATEPNATHRRDVASTSPVQQMGCGFSEASDVGSSLSTLYELTTAKASNGIET